ncbi:hypothetical protein PIROE2DRAFT_8064 [Piromyces sp. E2]|nr:hypothetical protein PIROE2DRAFT_8064 [Piromyces sp. E2]|eukprot:OUM65001.1 hypothetical protein PIROE2DRAFT_8064 [Piromyces sp. E2]
MFQYYIDDIKLLKKYDFFKNSRYYCYDLIKRGQIECYINLLFYIKLYLYYLKIKIRKIIVIEFIFQYELKYVNEEYIERIDTEDILSLFESTTDITSLEHYLYELVIKEYKIRQEQSIVQEHLKENEELELIAKDYFLENDNVEWINNYCKYIEKIGIYQKLLGDKSSIENTYLKYDVEIEPILSEACLIEDIRYDNEFIFNNFNKIKHIGQYKFGYTNAILQEVDFILKNIGNKDLLTE